MTFHNTLSMAQRSKATLLFKVIGFIRETVNPFTQNKGSAVLQSLTLQQEK